MSPLTALEQYLNEVKRRVQLTVATRGLGLAAAVALVLTLLLVVFANRYAFANWTIISGRTLLFGGLAAVIIFLLVRPLLDIRRSPLPWVRRLERMHPAFEERVRTFVDQKQESSRQNPIVSLLAEDTLRLAAEAPPEHVASSGPMWAFSAVGVLAVAVLVWLGVAGPGYLGYGTARLWAGWLKTENAALYRIVVEPGNTTVRRKADALIVARPIGFYAPNARLFAKYASSAKWEEAPMQRRLDDSGYEFVFAGVEEPIKYYVTAANVRSQEFDIKVVEMPNIKRLRLTYHYPSWTGLATNTEEPGGDIRAVAGTTVDLEIETDRPLANGVLRVDNETNLGLRAEANRSRGQLTIQKDSRYFVAALYNGELVRLSDDFFVEATPDREPTIKISRPGRDHKATSVEEVIASLQAEDDFGLKSLELRYSVNGGAEKSVPLNAGGRKQASAPHTFFLEDFSLVPGDVVSYYAVAKDAKNEAKTDIFFIEVQPFEREFFQSQSMGGGGGGQQEQEDQISRRQKEIVAATWNLARERNLDKAKAAEHAKTLSGIQSTLRSQAQTLAERMKRRELAGVNSDFKTFVENMQKAADAMGPASDKLSGQKWTDALAPEQKALQHLLRAESIFRQIQVAFGNQGGGGGGGMGRDLAEMFELELDTEKNQYETGQSGGSAGQQRDRELDDALEKLKKLARRQEQLAEEQRRNQQLSFDQRWQQEVLRREAEELKKQLEQIAQQQQQQQQQQQRGSQNGQQSQSSQGGQGGQSGQQQSASRSTLDRAIERLQQATKEMQQAGGGAGQQSEQQRQSRERAQQRLREVEDMLAAERRQQTASDLDDLSQKAAELASRQQASANKLKEAVNKAMEGQGQNQNPNQANRGVNPLNPQQAQALTKEKEQILSQLESLEKRMGEATRKLSQSQPKAGQQVREALHNVQQQELEARLRIAAELIRRGMAPYAAQREDPITKGLQQLREGLDQARQMAQSGQDPKGEKGTEQALARLEQLRQQLEKAMGQQPGGQQQGDQQGQGQQGREGQQGQGQQGQGQQGQGQQGQGQQGQGQQSGEGQQGQGQGQGQQGQGQQGGQQAGRGGPFGGSRGGGPHTGWAGDASNRGDWRLSPGRLPNPGDIDRAFREGRGELSQIERGLQSDPDFARDVEALRKEMRDLGNVAQRFPGNPALLSREQQALLNHVQQLELLLRRKLEEKQGAQVRAQTDQPVPENYRKAVAEYFRRLSREK